MKKATYYFIYQKCGKLWLYYGMELNQFQAEKTLATLRKVNPEREYKIEVK